MRLVGNIWVVQNAFHYREEYSALENDREKIIEHFENIEKNFPKEIDLKTVLIAENIVNYFIKSKLCMSGYNMNGEDIEIVPVKKTEPLKKETLERKILLNENRIIFLYDLSKSKLCNKNNFNQITKEFVSLGLGKLKKILNSKTKRTSIGFEKSLVPSINKKKELLTFVNNLQRFNVGIEEYCNSFINTDFQSESSKSEDQGSII